MLPIIDMPQISDLERWFSFDRQTTPVKIRLFCFPHAGGGASVFHAWQKQFSPEIQIFALQLPGRETRLAEAPYTEMPPLLSALADAILPHMKVQVAFFGHSFGALISFELARYLRRHYSVQPLMLFLSGHRAPDVPNELPRLSELPAKAFVDKLQELGTVPEAVLENTELLKLILPALRADFTIYENYEYQVDTPLDCPIAAFGASDDSLLDPSQLDPWSEQTRARCTIEVFRGDHFYLFGAAEAVTDSITHHLREQLSRSKECVSWNISDAR